MDTSKEYILMCEKAEEIQKDFMFPDSPFVNTEKGIVFLFIQEHLKILSKLTWEHFNKECLQFIEPTKEQAGIKVVMQQFNKEWKDLEWKVKQ